MTELRPRSIGEILRLALAVFARCWWPLLVVLALIAIPAALMFGLVAAVFAATAPVRVGSPAPFNPSAGLGFFALWLIALALYPLSLGAALTVTAATVDGEPEHPLPALRRAARRWATQFAVDVGAVCAAFCVMFPLLIIVVAPAVLNARSAGGAPVISNATGALPFLIAYNVLFAVSASLGTLVWLSAKMSAALETGNAITAVGLALVRVFNRSLFRRTFWFIVGLAAAEFAVQWLLLTAMSLTGAMRPPVAYAPGVPPPLSFVAPIAIFTLVLTMLFLMERVVVTTVYTRDLQVRLEGFDLARRAENDRDEPPDADGLTADDRALIAAFLTRRATLRPVALRALAAKIAARMRPKLQASFAHLDDEELLEHLGRPQG